MVPVEGKTGTREAYTSCIMLPPRYMPLPVDMVADLAAAVQEARIDEDLQVLSGVTPDADGATIRSRYIGHEDITRAAAYAQAQLEGAGWTVTAEPFSVGDTPCWNIVAELPGTKGPPWIVLGAHYDSIATHTLGWDPEADPAPGAEDDASGVAALLETARVLGGWGPGYTHSIRLVLFSAEEQGLVGSSAHVDLHLDEVVGWMGQMDPVGHEVGEMDVVVVYDARWPEAADSLVVAGAAIETPVRLTALDAVFLGGDARSDHAPYWDAGMPAVHISAPENLEVNHSVDDTYDLVSVPLVSAVASLMVAQVATEAGVQEAGGDGSSDTAYPKGEDPAGCGCGAGRGGGPASVLLVFLWGTMTIRISARRPCS